MSSDQSLIAELETAIQSGSKDKRVETLRRITDLFVADADRFSDQQINVFDDVLGHLMKVIEARALAELSQRLAPVANAPIEVVRRLARNDDVAVAAPVLTQSRRLSDVDLIDIANTKTQGHLLAIAGRSEVRPGVTDVLLQRGDRQVFHKLAENSGASFSEGGFATLVKHSEGDNGLAEKVGVRLDLPSNLFRELLLRATEAVRSRLLAVAGPEIRERLQRVLATISEDAQHEAGIQSDRDYAAAQARMKELQARGELNQATLFELAKDGRCADMLAGLSLLCSAPMSLIESLMQSDHREAWLVPCKVAGLEWPTVRTILTSRCLARAMPEQALEAARTDYFKLSQSGAGRVLRFWQVRKTVSKEAPAEPSAAPLYAAPLQAAQSSRS